MKRRSLAAVIILPFITLGIYALYWLVKTKGELNAKGAQIPTAWLIIIPLVNIWWMWKYFEGADSVSNGEINGVLNFVLYFFIGLIIPMILCQLYYNKVAEGSVVASPTDNSGESNESTAQEVSAPAATEEAPTPPATPTPPTIPTV